jgi:ATP-binding cassette, subfamily B, bacterial
MSGKKTGKTYLMASLAHRFYVFRILKLIWKTDALYASVTVLLLLLEIFALYELLIFTKNLFNLLPVYIKSGGNIRELKTKFLWAVGAALVFTLLGAATTLVTEILGVRLNQAVDKMIHDKSISLDIAFFESPAYFDTLFRARQAGADRPHSMLLNLLTILKSILGLAVIAIFVTRISVWMIPILSILVIPTLYIRILFSNRLFEWRAKQAGSERRAGYYSWLITDHLLAKEIKVFGLGQHFCNKYLSIQRYLHKRRVQNSKTRTLYELITSLVAVIGVYFVIGFLIQQAVHGGPGFGDITLVILTIPQAYLQLQSLSANLSTLYENNRYASYLFKLFSVGINKPEFGTPIPPFSSLPSLQLSKVSFHYQGTEVNVVDNVTMSIAPGKITAVVGLNGAGKSTLVKLLLRLYEPDQGKILLEGIDAKVYSLESYRELFSVVFQDFGRYNSSILENIAYGDIKKAIDATKAEDVLIKATGEDLTKKFEGGIDALLGQSFDEGKDLSIGQWQKLAIARALYRSSQFLLLDEPTSAMDAVSEHELITNLRSRAGGRSVLIISHRVSTVMHADYIYVMENGRVKEQGTHEDLVASNGTYAMLFLSRSREKHLQS